MTNVVVLAGMFMGAAEGQPGDFFEKRVRPVLAEHCFSCHGPKKQSAGLRLDSHKALMEGSDNGPVVVPGQPDKSPLVAALAHTGQVKMPPKGKLPAEAIEAFTAWVKLGAPWPDVAVKMNPDIAADAWKKHWTFRPIANPA